jgi:hypothetical protein
MVPGRLSPRSDRAVLTEIEALGRPESAELDEAGDAPEDAAWLWTFWMARMSAS